ncbi:MAG TPA: DNA-binding protein WhiA [Caproiciproducens sp.]|nr:DNA-binding protein WhiA [Caproiciproducens sp.]
MSFSSEVKNELCRTMPQNSCCQKAECYGLLLFGRSFSKHAVEVKAADRASTNRTAQLAAEVTGAIVDISSSMLRRKENHDSYFISIAGDDQRGAVLSCFGHTGDEISLRINRANLENDCCVSAFLRGVFLSCGTVTDPQKDYHLEFVVPYMNLARDLTSLIGEILELDLQPGMLNRRGSYVVYIKGSERVADLITFIGAGNAAMELMQTKMLKEVRNNINRKTNFETANIEKTAQAAAAQILAIEKILKSSGGISALPEELQELAVLRYRNPEMSLRELGESLTEPLSRSGVNHRLQRIIDIAEEI